MTISNEAVEAAASKSAEVYETLRSYGATAPEAIVAAVDEFQAAAPHLYPASGEVGEAVKRLTDCATNEKAHWSLLPDAGACVDVPVSDLRAVLSALSEATERAGRMEAARAHLDTLADLYRSQRDDAQAEATRLKEKLDEAGKVIAPLASAGGFIDSETTGFQDDDTVSLALEDIVLERISIGHLRAALRWTEEASQGEGE